jgi:flagellar P-ring protein precursor FlgI
MLRVLASLILVLLATETVASARIKDITSIRGIRENQLIGYGLVIGLAGSGDTLRNSPFTEQSLQSMLNHLGVNVRDAALRTRNVAAVMVTAELPPFIGRGSRIDVTVSSLGDAKSLMGGMLLMTQLQGADGEVYAVAQGGISVSGFAAEGDAESVSQGVATTGRIPNGAVVEQVVPASFEMAGPIVLELRNPDFGTALAIARAINEYTSDAYGVRAAQEDNARQLTLFKPSAISAARFVAEIGALRVTPDTPAKVVIDERTGTVVIGSNVQISPVAVAHGTLTVRITETPIVSQPGPLSEGDTVVVPRTEVEADQPDASLAIVGGADLRMLVHGLNQIGLKPTGIIAILQAIKSAGALQADLVLQ